MNTNGCTYRELKAKMSDRDEHIVRLYCPGCGTNVGKTGVYDDNWRTECYDCGLSLNPRVTVAIPNTNYSFDSIGVEQAQAIVVSYWNRSMRYGFRLGDRIAIDLRAAEYESYAQDLDIDWELVCPMFRQPLDELAAEGVSDTEFNHFEYEDTDGESPKQFAHGFTASRVAHDYVHKNLQTWALDEMCSGAGIDWQQFQAYRVIDLEHRFYTAINGDCEPTNRKFLAHVVRYYDVPFDVDWMVTAYEQTASVKDDLAYDHWKRKSAGWMAKKNIKGFTEQAEAIEFIERKEKREQRAIDHIETMLDADEWSPATGYDLGLEHPLAR